MLLYSKYPMREGCAIANLESQLRSKNDPIITALLGIALHKSSIDASYTLVMNEANEWPIAKAFLDKATKDKDAVGYTKELLVTHQK